eukprot:12917006-Prorocentrum_lima.AAC.1
MAAVIHANITPGSGSAGGAAAGAAAQTTLSSGQHGYGGERNFHSKFKSCCEQHSQNYQISCTLSGGGNAVQFCPRLLSSN